MKNVLTCCLVLFIGLAYGQGTQLKLEDKAPLKDAKMNGVSGSVASLADLNQENGIVVIFSCNTCPFVVAWENRYNPLYQFAKEHKVGMAVINSNYLKRDGDDSPEAMKKHAEDKGYQFPYLIDAESQLANAFGAQTTPHVFLFDKNFQLVYKGAIDDNYKNAEEVHAKYLENAISSLAKGEKIAVAETKPMGCSIKRKIH